MRLKFFGAVILYTIAAVSTLVYDSCGLISVGIPTAQAVTLKFQDSQSIHQSKDIHHLITLAQQIRNQAQSGLEPQIQTTAQISSVFQTQMRKAGESQGKLVGEMAGQRMAIQGPVEMPLNRQNQHIPGGFYVPPRLTKVFNLIEALKGVGVVVPDTESQASPQEATVTAPLEMALGNAQTDASTDQYAGYQFGSFGGQQGGYGGQVAYGAPPQFAGAPGPIQGMFNSIQQGRQATNAIANQIADNTAGQYNRMQDFQSSIAQGQAAVTGAISGSLPATNNQATVRQLQQGQQSQQAAINGLLNSLQTKINTVGDDMARKTQAPIIEAQNQNRILQLSDQIKAQEALDRQQIVAEHERQIQLDNKLQQHSLEQSIQKAQETKAALIQEFERTQQKEELTIEQELKKAAIEAERKSSAKAAVKEVMGKEKRHQLKLEHQKVEHANFQAYLEKKREKREWKMMQETLLKSLSDRLRNWKYKGTWDARKELYELLSASSAALKAQYWRTTDGLTPEENAFKAAEKATRGMSKNSTHRQRQVMAKKVADAYLQQDVERRKSIMQIDQAIEMLGPMDKAKGSVDLQFSVNNMNRVLGYVAVQKPNQKPKTPCEKLADKTISRITQTDPFKSEFRDTGGKNPMLLDSPVSDAKIKKKHKRKSGMEEVVGSSVIELKSR